MINPQTEEELAHAIRDAQGALRIQGGGTRPGLGNPVDASTILSTSKLSGITLYEPAALTLIVQAGTPMDLIEKTLSAQNQQLAFEPMDHRALFGTTGTPTIGAVAACNIAGPRRIQAGACRDSMIGVRFVDGRGDIISNGGRVMKNVTGYDLVKLMAGSFGTLGVLSEISFKVQPKPPASATITLHGLDDAAGVQALCRVLASPNDVTGAAHISGDSPRTMIRIEGLPKSVEFRLDEIKTIFINQNITVDTECNWSDVRDATLFADHTGDVWRISVKPTDGPTQVQILREAGIAQRVMYDWSGGLIWVGTPKGAKVREHLSAPGHASRVRGVGADAVHPGNATVAKIEHQLREQFDPRGILNPGIMG